MKDKVAGCWSSSESLENHQTKGILTPVIKQRERKIVWGESLTAASSGKALASQYEVHGTKECPL